MQCKANPSECDIIANSATREDAWYQHGEYFWMGR